MGISKEKKREYNERYRSKLKNKPTIETKEPEPQPEPEPKPETPRVETPRIEKIPEVETENPDLVVISKQELYNYLLKMRAVQTEEVEEPETEEKKKVLPPEESIITKIQNSFITSTVSTLGSMLLPLSMLLISNYLPMPSKPSLLPKPQFTKPPEESAVQFQIPTGNLF